MVSQTGAFMDLPNRDNQRLDIVRRQAHELCVTLSPALFGWAILRLRGFDQARIEPEDIVQETWLRALGSVTADSDRVANRDGFRAWLFGIAQNVLLEELRRGRSRRPSIEDPSSSWLELQTATVTSICTGLARNETVKRVVELADELDELDGQLLLRCAFEDVTASDVGRRAGVEPATAIRRWQRLRGRLKDMRLDEALGLLSA